jgi:hypothetical protein
MPLNYICQTIETMRLISGSGLSSQLNYQRLTFFKFKKKRRRRRRRRRSDETSIL